MKYSALLFVCCACLGAQAQTVLETQILARHQGSPPTSPLYKQQVSPMHLASVPGKRKKTAGLIMMATGATMIISGGFIFKEGREDSRAWHRANPGEKTFGMWENDKEAGGAVLIGVGIGATVSGMVLWTQGARLQHRMKLEALGIPKPLPGTRKKNGGIALVTLGAAAQIGGIILIHKQREQDKKLRSTTGRIHGLNGTSGAFALLAGTALASTGAIMWWTGSISVNRAKPTTQQSLHFNVGPTPSLCYRF
jgi:hypothetical protein